MASKIGAGIFQNAYGHGANVVTAGQKDYQMRMMQIERQREDYYRKLGTPPGVPTMKGATAEPENTHEGYNTIIRELGDHSVPDGWIQRPKSNAVPGTSPGPPVQWDKAEDPDDVQPGYGYVPADTAHHEEIFYYHSDHLGSTSYITDAKANITQFDAYLPYGELLVDEHSSTEEMPYKFNGKELDQETGLYYYGARYMNPRTSLWYGVDPLAEKYPSVGGYVYCVENPIKYLDTDGRRIVIHYQDKNGNQRTYIFMGYRGKKSIYIPNVQFVKDFVAAYNYNARNGGGENTILAATSDKYEIHLYDGDSTIDGDMPDTENFGRDGKNIVRWQSRKGLKFRNGRQSPATRLEHEFSHAVDRANNPRKHRENQRKVKEGHEMYDTEEEFRVIEGSERKTAQQNGESIRHHHRGTTFTTEGPTSTKSKKK